MTQPETDADYRQRIAKVCSEDDRQRLWTAYGKDLDAIGRKWDRYRFGKPLFEEPKKESTDA